MENTLKRAGRPAGQTKVTNFPNKIRAVRKELELTQAQLAERAGISPQRVFRAEVDGIASVKTFRIIANALNTSIEKIL